MKKVIRNPITLLIFFTLILHVAIPLLLDTANKQLSTYIPIKEGYVNVSSIPEKKIGILRFSPSQDIVFTILGEEDLQISFMYKEGKVPFNYYIDRVKYENSNNLTHRPKVLTYENSPIHVEIFSKGSTIKSNGNRMVFIGRAEDIEYFNFLKITYSTVMMTINAMLLIGSLVIFWKFKTRYMLILLLISIVSIIKIFVDAGLLFSITTSILALFLFETSSGIFLFFLSQFLFYSIFHIHFQRKYIIMYMFLSISLEISYLLNHYLPLLLFSHLISIIAIIYMANEACKHKRKWITLLTLSYMGYSATVVYRFCITLGIFERGYFSTLIFSPQLGFVLFIGIALFTVIATYAHRVHVLEIEKRKYERITLLQGISHDLKIPLSIIKLNNQMIENYPLKEQETVKLASTSLESISDLERMVEQIHSYINAEDITQEATPVSLKAHLETLCNRYSIACSEKHITLQLITVNCEQTVMIQALPFDRIITNIIDNSLKYTFEGSISIECSIDTTIRVQVKDTGIGIAKEHILNVFDPHFKVDNSRNTQSMGLGLSVVKLLLEHMGGSYYIKSRINEGTEITFQIPYIKQSNH